jgi:hypothetical protein
MISCPIKTSKEWKTLTAALDEDRAMLAFIRNDGIIPDTAKARELITNKGLLESLQLLPKLSEESLLESLRSTGLIIGEPMEEDGQDYYTINNDIPNIGEELSKYTTQYGGVMDYKGDRLAINKESLKVWNRVADMQRMENKSLTDLCKNFLVSVGVGLSEQDDVIKKFGSNGIADFAEKMVRIQSGMMDEALPEEALHFFLDMIPQSTPALMEALDKIRSTNTYKATLEQYKDNPNYRINGVINISKIKKEALAKEIASRMKDKEAKGWIADLINTIINWIKGLKIQKDPLDILEEMFFSGEIALLNTNLKSSEVYNQLTDEAKSFYESQASTPEQKETLEKILAYALHTEFNKEEHSYTYAQNLNGEKPVSATTAIGSDFYSEIDNPDIISKIVDTFGVVLSKQANIKDSDTKSEKSQKIVNYIVDGLIATNDVKNDLTMKAYLEAALVDSDLQRLKEILFTAAGAKTKTLFGTAIHAIAEAAISGKPVSLEDVDPIIFKVMTKQQLSDLVYGTPTKEGLLDVIKKMVKNGSVIMTEVVLSNGKLAGTLDIIEIKKDGVAEIYDFKTKFLGNFKDNPYVKENLITEFKSVILNKSKHGIKPSPELIVQLENLIRNKKETWSQQLSIYKKLAMSAGISVGGLHIVGVPYRLDATTKQISEFAIEEINDIPFDSELANYMFDTIDPALDASIKKKEVREKDIRIATIEKINNDSLKQSFAKSLGRLMQLLNKFKKGDKTNEIYKLLEDASSKTNNLADQANAIRQTLENFDTIKDTNILAIQQNFLEIIDSSGPIVGKVINRFDELKALTPTDKQGASQRLNELMKVKDFLTGYREMFEELVEYLKDADQTNVVKVRLNELIGLTTSVNNEYISVITPVIVTMLGESFNQDLLNNMKLEYNELIAAARVRKDKKREEALIKERDNLPSSAIIEELLKGNKGDIGPVFSKLIATISNPDIIIAAAAKRLKAALDRVRLKDKIFIDNLDVEIRKRFDVYGRGIDIKANNEKLTYVAEETNPFTGEHMNVLYFLSEFDEKIYSEQNKLKYAIIEATKTKDPEKIKDAKNELKEFEKKYLQTGFTNEYYRLTKALDVKVKYFGKDTTVEEIHRDLRDQISSIEKQYPDDKIDSGDIPPIVYKELQQLHDKESQLREKLDEKGNPKTGDALKIAEALEEYSKNSKLLYEYTINMDKYNKAKELAKLQFGVGSEKYEEWISNNTKLTISDDYYKDLADINAELLALSENEGGDEIRNLYKELKTITNKYQDKDGYIKGSMINEEVAARINAIQEKINDYQSTSSYNPFNIYTKEEVEQRATLYYLKNNKLPGFSQAKLDKITLSANLRLAERKAKNPTLAEDIEIKQKRYDELIKLRSSLLKKETTKYYSIEKENQERSFAEAIKVDYKTFMGSKEYYEQFTKSPWFVNNHIIKTNVLFEDEDTGETRESLSITPTYQWQRNLPVEKYITQSPANQYRKTIFKESYIDDKGNTVKLLDTENLDVRGRLKPKSNTDYRKEFGVNHPFLNEKYTDLRSKYNNKTVNQKEKVDYENLLYIQKNMIDSQEDIEMSQRLGLAVPFMEKHIFERVVSSRGGNIVEGAKSRVGNIVEGIQRNLSRTDQDIDQTGLTTKADDKRGDISKLATMDNDQVRFVPVRFSTKGDVENASYDVWGGVLHYVSSINRKKELDKELAFINGLETILGEKANQPKSEDNNLILNNIYKSYKLDLSAKINLGSNTRLEVLKSFVNSVMYNEENFEGFDIFGINTQKAMGVVSSLASFTAMGASPLSWATNFLSGNIQNIIEAVGGQNFTFKEYTKAHGDVYGGTGGRTSAVRDMQDDFVKGKVGHLSLTGQFMQVYDPIQGEQENEFGEKTKFNGVKNIFSLGLYAGKIWGEWEIQMKTFYSFMRSHKLYNGQVMDRETFITKKMGTDVDSFSLDEIKTRRLKALQEWETITVNLLDMHELGKDGILKIKDEYSKDFQIGSPAFSDIVAKLHAMQKRINGAYAKFDKAYAEKTSMGKMVYFFRKYFLPLGINRWGYRRPNFESMTTEQGFYLTFLQTVGKDITKFKFNVIKNWDTYSPKEKIAIKKTLADIVIVLAIMATLSLVFGWDPDDPDRFKKLKEKGWAAQAAVFILLKTRSETEQFLPPFGVDEVRRVYENPSLIFTQTSQYIKVVKLLGIHALNIFPGNYDSSLYYSKKVDDSGLKDEGDSKLMAVGMKSFVGYSGRFFHPIDALKSFEYMSKQ